MTYIRDGDVFAVTFGGHLDSGLVAVGWLDSGFPYERGKVPSEFVELLREKCRIGTNRTRGLHRCTLCAHAAEVGRLPPETKVHSESGDFVVGGAEIRVKGPSGTRYASPDMVIHYVEEHGYRPPADYIAGVVGEA